MSREHLVTVTGNPPGDTASPEPLAPADPRIGTPSPFRSPTPVLTSTFGSSAVHWSRGPRNKNLLFRNSELSGFSPSQQRPSSRLRIAHPPLIVRIKMQPYASTPWGATLQTDQRVPRSLAARTSQTIGTTRRRDPSGRLSLVSSAPCHDLADNRRFQIGPDFTDCHRPVAQRAAHCVPAGDFTLDLAAMSCPYGRSKGLSFSRVRCREGRVAR